MDDRPRIGLITSVLLKDEYNDFTSTRPAALHKAQVLREALASFGEVTSSALLEDESSARAASEELRRGELDCIVYAALSYNKGILASQPLIQSDLPLIIWNTQHRRALGSGASWDEMWTNSGLAGVPELCNTLLRARRRFRIVTGPMEDGPTLARIGDYARSAWLTRRMRHWRIAQIGQAYGGMSDLSLDWFDLSNAIGPTVIPVDPGTVAEGMSNVQVEDVDELLSSTLNRYTVGVKEKGPLRQSATLALAMERAIRQEARADGAAVLDQVWLKDPRIGIPPTFPYLYLNAKGIPCANEADAVAVVALLVLQSLAGRSAIVEFFDMDFDSQSVILCHDTNGNPAMARDERDVRLQDAPLYAGVQGSGIACEFAYPQGEVTLLSMARLPSGWRMIVAEGRAIEAGSRSIGAPFMRFRHEGRDIGSFCEAWCLAGATHHMAASYGRWASRIEDLAFFLGAECVRV